MADKLEKTNTGYYKANQGFATTFEGEPLFLKEGELVAKGHPMLKGREDLFVPAEKGDISRFDRPDVEQATAAPGEKRGRGRPRKVIEVEEAPVEEPAAEPEPEPEPEPEEDEGGEAGA